MKLRILPKQAARNRILAASQTANRQSLRILRAPRRQPEPTPERIMQIAWGYAPPLILETALHYRIFDSLDERPQTAEELAATVGASVRGIKAILDALVGLEFLERQANRYGLTPESKTFLVSSKPAYHGAHFTHMTRQLIPRWLHLAEAVRTGRPAHAANQEDEGATFFSSFVESLFPLSYAAARRLGKHLGLAKATAPVSVLDIGAGSGVWGIALAHESPRVKIRAVDWPAVLEVTRKVAARQGVADRMELASGNLLEADFGRGHHIATVGHVLHSEGSARSRRLLEHFK